MNKEEKVTITVDTLSTLLADFCHKAITGVTGEDLPYSYSYAIKQSILKDFKNNMDAKGASIQNIIDMTVIQFDMKMLSTDAKEECDHILGKLSKKDDDLDSLNDFLNEE